MRLSPQLRLGLFLAGFVCLFVLIRLAYGIGWGNLDDTSGPEVHQLGIAQGILDNLSYAAWAQQARDGIIPFVILQTTEPHEAIFIAPVFVVIGKAAAFLEWHPLLLMNIAAPFFAALTLWLVFRASLEIGFSRLAAWLAMLFTAFGSGLSAITILVTGKAKWAVGADISYLDLFPSTILPFFPYHGLGLASICALLLVVLKAEGAMHQGRRGWLWLAVCFTMALIAICIRPYAPISFTAIFAVYTAVAFFRRSDRKAALARLMILIVLAAAIAPLTLYYFWVGTQPVWADFRAASLDLTYNRGAWLIGFGLFWPAAGAGAFIGLRQANHAIALIVLWAVFIFVLLVVLNAGQTKLADGGFVALAMLSALTVERIIDRIRSIDDRRRRVWASEALMVLGFFSCLSTIVAYGGGPSAEYYTVDREVVVAARKIREAHPGVVPTVLSEARVGAALAAIASLRVYVGHWSLTLNEPQKTQQLVDAGFEEASTALARTNEERQAALAHLRAAAKFDYVLILKSRPAYPLLLSDPALTATYDGARWVLFKIDAS